MASSLFQNARTATPATQNRTAINNMQGMMQQVRQIKQILQGQNPDVVAQVFARQNHQFAKFAKETAGKSPQEIAQSYGLDWNMVQQMIG